MQTFQMLAATAANLTIDKPEMNYLRTLMGSQCPPCFEGIITEERLNWMLEAEARYRVRLAQKILDVAQAEHK